MKIGSVLLIISLPSFSQTGKIFIYTTLGILCFQLKGFNVTRVTRMTSSRAGTRAETSLKARMRSSGRAPTRRGSACTSAPPRPPARSPLRSWGAPGSSRHCWHWRVSPHRTSVWPMMRGVTPCLMFPPLGSSRSWEISRFAAAQTTCKLSILYFIYLTDLHFI